MKLVSYLIVPWAILTERRESTKKWTPYQFTCYFTFFSYIKSEKRVTTAPHATAVTLSSKNCNEEDLQTITTSVENKRKWRKHTWRETWDRIKRRNERNTKKPYTVFTVKNSASTGSSSASAMETVCNRHTTNVDQLPTTLPLFIYLFPGGENPCLVFPFGASLRVRLSN